MRPVEADRSIADEALRNKPLQDKVVSLIADHFKGEAQLLTPMKKGSLGALELNRVLASGLNPHRRKHTEVVAFVRGDRVINLRNRYEDEVFNGEAGIVRRAKKDVVVVDFPHITGVEYMKGNGLAWAYALTIHKCQGSEYPIVVIPLTLFHSIMLKRRLLYTAVTRGKERARRDTIPKIPESAVGSLGRFRPVRPSH